MLLNGQGSLISKRSFIAKSGKEYFFIKVIDEQGSELELSTKGDLLDFKQFSKCNFTVDVVQGKYPRYDLVSLSLVEDK